MTWLPTDSAPTGAGFWSWLGDWAVAFLQSPGFGWSLFVIAAAIVGTAAMQNALRTRRWNRVQQAVERSVSGNETERKVGLSLLQQLKTTADAEDAAFIRAAIDAVAAQYDRPTTHRG